MRSIKTATGSVDPNLFRPWLAVCCPQSAYSSVAWLDEASYRYKFSGQDVAFLFLLLYKKDYLMSYPTPR
jgi:hypothetical protein